MSEWELKGMKHYIRCLIRVKALRPTISSACITVDYLQNTFPCDLIWFSQKPCDVDWPVVLFPSSTDEETETPANSVARQKSQTYKAEQVWSGNLVIPLSPLTNSYLRLQNIK